MWSYFNIYWKNRGILGFLSVVLRISPAFDDIGRGFEIPILWRLRDFLSTLLEWNLLTWASWILLKFYWISKRFISKGEVLLIAIEINLHLRSCSGEGFEEFISVKAILKNYLKFIPNFWRDWIFVNKQFKFSFAIFYIATYWTKCLGRHNFLKSKKLPFALDWPN